MRLELLGHKRHFGGLRGVQQVPALAVLTVTAQLIKAGAAPHIGSYAPLVLQKLTRRHGFTQDGA